MPSLVVFHQCDICLFELTFHSSVYSFVVVAFFSNPVVQESNINKFINVARAVPRNYLKVYQFLSLDTVDCP